MSEVILTLGSIAFRDFEVPEQIVFGGGQSLAVHQIIGGGRVVDMLGAADGEVLLAGVFSGPDAAGRAQALDVARSLGGILPLVWKGFFYSVIIAELIAVYTKPWWIPFRLRLVVVRDLVAALPSLLDQATLDLAAAQIYAPQAGLSLAGISVSSSFNLEAGLATANTLLLTTGTNFSQNVATLNGAADTTTGASAIQNMTNTAGILAGVAAVQAYLSRASASVSGALA